MKERIRTALHNTSNRIYEPLRPLLEEALTEIERLERITMDYPCAPLPTAEIGVECNMTNPPAPTNFGIRQNGRITSILTLQQVENALNRYYELSNEHDKSRFGL